MNLILPIFSIFLLVLLQIVFYSKSRIVSSETNIYKYLMMLSTFNVILNVVGIYIGYTSGNISLLKVLNHFDLPIYFWWTSLLFLYLVSVDIKDKRKYNFIKKFDITLCCLFTLITLFLPFEVIISETDGYAIGLCVNFVYIICAIFIVLSIIEAIKITKKGMTKKAVPVFMLIILGAIAAIIQKNNPNLIIIPAMITYIELIMFFTIENPDVKVLEEYNRNKELVERNIEDKANMLFKITEDVRVPIRKIKTLNNSIASAKDLATIKETTKDIDFIASDLMSIIDNVLDVSSIDKKSIKFFETNYNIYNLFNQIVYLVKSRIDSKIDFKYSIVSTIPEKLYGDSTKLKQIICSLLLQSFKNKAFGVVDLDINSIVRYDVCRLIITIRDTAKKMTLFEINNILESDSNIPEKELEQINNLEIDIKIIKKIIDLMGGIFLIKSSKDVGVTYTIVLNQLIQEVKNNDTIASVNRVLSNKDKVLLVDDNYKELERYASELRKNDFEVVSTMYGKDCVNKISNGESYDYILIDDEMGKYSAVMTISELQEMNLKKTKIIVMLEKDKESIKEHYLEDYPFADYLLKENYKEEIKRIKEKF